MFLCILFHQVLSDDTKRQEYDTWGATSEQMSRAETNNRSSAEDFMHRWNFKSNIDPEELFRKIFGDSGFDFKVDDSEHIHNQYGFGNAQEVRTICKPVQ